jgi:protein O-mannosyl-transferase
MNCGEAGRMPHQINRRRRIPIRPDAFVPVMLVIVTLAVYWNVRHFDFVYDDESYITKNAHVQAGLTLEGIRWTFLATDAHNWHPVTWLSHLLDVQLHGLNPGMHHFTNLLFHILNSLLLFHLFKRMTGDPWRSGLAAALFALHPLNVESVAWIAERKNVLSTFFWMLTIWGYIRYLERPGAYRYALVLLTFSLGLMSKPMLVTLPFVLLLMDYWPLNRFHTRTKNALSTAQPPRALLLVREKLPLMVIAAAVSVITLLVQHIRPLDAYPLSVRVANALVSYARYLEKMIWPYRLSPIYLHPGMMPGWQIAFACVLLASVSLLVIRSRKSHPALLVGWLWYLGTLVPVIGLVQIGLQSMADRYAYVPLIGIFIMVAWGIPVRAEVRSQKIVLVIAAVTLLACMTVRTWLQVQHWENSITLFEHAVHVTPGNFVAQYNLACGYAMNNRTDESVYWLDQSLKNGNPYWNIIKTDSDLENIRGTGYYKHLMKTMEGR